jgi:hypothetical protein
VKDRRPGPAVFDNYRGYVVGRSVSLDTSIRPNVNNPYTVLMTTFGPGEEAKFSFTLWYKQSNGAEVTFEEFR